MRTLIKNAISATKAIAFASVVLSVILVAGCTFTLPTDEGVEVVPFNTIKPELDYSAESPDCELAAQRIKDNLVVGMTLADVKRLVGQPRLIMPGSWWWTAGFSKSTGKPRVSYPLGPSADDVPITSFRSNTDGC